MFNLFFQVPIDIERQTALANHSFSYRGWNVPSSVHYYRQDELQQQTIRN